MQKGSVKQVKYKRMGFFKAIAKYKWLYLMLIIPLSQYFLFRYAPLSGLQVAFKDFSVFKGIGGSPWAIPIPIILAIMVYEMRSVKVKRLYQTLMYLPHFLSWVIIGSLVAKIFGTSGPINSLITQMGGTPVNFLMDEGNWVVMYVATGIWQSAGWGTIIYLAAISGVNTDLYEAAEVDGCGRLRRIWYVTLPCIMPTIVIMLILRLGQMVGIGFERPYVMMNKMVTDSADVISTFVYDRGILNRQYPFATAVDIFGSVVNMCFVIGANIVTRRMGEGGLF